MLAETLNAHHGAMNAHATPETDDRFVTPVTSTWRRRARGGEVMTAVVAQNLHRRAAIPIHESRESRLLKTPR